MDAKDVKAIVMAIVYATDRLVGATWDANAGESMEPPYDHASMAVIEDRANILISVASNGRY